MSNRGYSRFHNLNIVGCLRKKRLIKPYKGGGGGEGSSNVVQSISETLSLEITNTSF